MNKASCKKCRRAGEKLFLKGDRCTTSKCAIVKRPYAPGIHGKKRRRSVSEYATQLLAKQKLCWTYGIRERQLKRYFKEASKEKGIVGFNLLKKLETRLDTILFRLKWAESQAKSRQLVNHGHILVNDKKVDIPSFGVKVGDIIKIKKNSSQIGPFKNLGIKLKKLKTPDWLSLNKDKSEGSVLAIPKIEDINIPVDIQRVVEYYSR